MFACSETWEFRVLRLALLSVFPGVKPIPAQPDFTCRTFPRDLDPFYYQECGKCYILSDTLPDWRGAKDICDREGATLAKVDTSAEFGRLKNALVRYTSHRAHAFLPQLCFYIGANDRDKEGHWVWLDGIAVKFSAWSVVNKQTEGLTDPAEDCAAMYIKVQSTTPLDDLYLEKTACDKRERFVCQYDRTLNPTANLSLSQETENGDVSVTWICKTFIVEDFDPVYYQDKENCYFLSDKKTSFEEAYDCCEKNGASLAKVNSPVIFDKMKEAIIVLSEERGFTSYSWLCVFMGANDRDQEGNWVWTDDCSSMCGTTGGSHILDDFYWERTRCVGSKFACRYDAIPRIVQKKPKLLVSPPTIIPKVQVLAAIGELTGYFLTDLPDWSDKIYMATQCGRKCSQEGSSMFVFCQKTGCCQGYTKMPQRPFKLVKAPDCSLWESRFV